MTWVLPVVGAALVLLIVRDIFHTLWHPRGFGALARRLFVIIWRTSRRLPAGLPLELAGPVALMVTALVWSGGVMLGFALIYLPSVPEGLGISSQARPLPNDLVTAVYLSLVTLATLGFGDVTPGQWWLQLLAPLEALLGFVLLTAVISWVLQIYPSLARRRALARRLSSMAATGTAEMLPHAQASVAVSLLEDVRSSLATAEMDFAQYAESYYFHDRQRDVSLAVGLMYVPRLIEAAHGSGAAEVRHAGSMLEDGLDRLTDLLAVEFGISERTDPAHVLPEYARDHRQL